MSRRERRVGMGSALSNWVSDGVMEEDEGGSGLLVGRERRVEAMMEGGCYVARGESVSQRMVCSSGLVKVFTLGCGK